MSDDRLANGREDLITSPANPTIKLARSLHRKRVRYRERALLVEGTRAIQAAIELGVNIRATLVDASRVADVDTGLLSQLQASSARTLVVDPALFEQITDTEHPQPLVLICDMPRIDLPADCSFVIALDGIRDPGNLGTLIRSAAAAGADGVALLHGSVDPSNPKVVRATVGSLFAIPVQSFASIDDVVRGCFLKRPNVVVADSDGDLAYDQVDWALPAIVVVGAEATGVSEDPRTYADIVVQIPMSPGVESLNAGVAGSIIAFEIARQRRMRN